MTRFEKNMMQEHLVGIYLWYNFDEKIRERRTFGVYVGPRIQNLGVGTSKKSNTWFGFSKYSFVIKCVFEIYPFELFILPTVVSS